MKKRLIAALVFFSYSAILIKIIVLKDLPTIRIFGLMLNFGGTQEGSPNFIPFKTILPYLLLKRGLVITIFNLVGNVVLFIPIGLLLPIMFKEFTSKKAVLLSMLTGLLVEGLQVLFRVGIFDVDDVILNGLGVMIGYWIFRLLEKKSRSIHRRPLLR